MICLTGGSGMSDEIYELEAFYGCGGQLRYKCPMIWPPAIAGKLGKPCEFDHYSPDVVLEHMHSTHNTQAEAEATRINLLDSKEDKGKAGVEIIGATNISDAVGKAKRRDVQGDSTSGARRSGDRP
jgi:hypothetical protein